MQTQLKLASFPLTKSKGRVAYLVGDDNKIYYTALQAHPSTFEYADDIVFTICRRERVDWRNFDFYDIQTVTGYPAAWRKSGDYSVEQLEITNVESKDIIPTVQALVKVESSIGWYPNIDWDPEVEEAVDSDVLEAFRTYIGE